MTSDFITALTLTEPRLSRLNDCFLQFGCNPDQNINRLVALCGDQLNATCALYNQLQGPLLCSLGQWQTPADYQAVDQADGHICYDVIQCAADSPIVIRNLPATVYHQTDPNVARYDLQTYVGIAVKWNQQAVGSLCVVFQSDIDLCEDDLQLMSIIASAIGIEEERKRAQAALCNSEERFRLIAENAPDYILLLEPAGEIKFINHAGSLPHEQIIGSNLLDWVRSDQRAHLQAALQTVKAGSAIEIDLPALLGQSRGERWFNGRLAPLYTDGEVTSLVAVCTDITERKQAEETQRQYAAELEAQNAELDAFAHTVAHDLKNPVGHIAGYLELLQLDYQRFSDEARLDIIQRATVATNRLVTIIDELLLLSRIRQTEVRMYALAMGGIVATAVARLSEQIRLTHATLSLPDIWPRALGHAPWIEEIWVNYLSNALKYGGQPPRIELGFDQPIDGKLRFWVQDNGHGLSADEQARLFIPFTRLSKTVAHGHGLGLSIVRRVAERLGGEAGVQSEPGQGARFYFTLRPATESDETDIAQRATGNNE
ncbi:MAG: PAS domain S-box protein [Chloroflexi bacterium]|nr:PAS domain S-box protein [Chloroflexota bacterium]